MPTFYLAENYKVPPRGLGEGEGEGSRRGQWRGGGGGEIYLKVTSMSPFSL